MDERRRRPPLGGKKPAGPGGVTPFQRPNPRGTGPLGTGPLGPLPPLPQPGAMPRLDPSAPDGEVSFVLPDQGLVLGQDGRPLGLVAEADGAVPPALLHAVEEVLGFIYGLDRPTAGRGR